MSTVSPAARDETGRNIVVRQPTPPGRAEPKVTAAQIENDCPARLQVIGEEIAKRFNVAHEEATLFYDHHVKELANLIAEARELCDLGGFGAFQEKFFPNLRKSRVYEWLAIATKKKTVEETRAGTRERVAKHRANKPAAQVSVTVTETSEPEVQRGPPDDDLVQATIPATEQASQATKHRSSVTPGDEALVGFSAVVCELVRRTRNKQAERFAKTTVPADTLATLGNLLVDLANLKRSDTAKPVTCDGTAGDAG